MNGSIIIIAICWCMIWGAVTYSVMKNKGHESPGVWFFIGFFLEIFGLIIALVQPNQQQHYSSQQTFNDSTSSRNTQICKSCGETNSSSSTHCQKCGLRLNKPTSLIQNKEGSWKCKCGALNYPYETSCHRCGEKKPFKSSNTPEKTPTSPAQVKAMAQKEKFMTEQLEELKKMLDQGLITEADFEAKKKQILGI